MSVEITSYTRTAAHKTDRPRSERCVGAGLTDAMKESKVAVGVIEWSKRRKPPRSESDVVKGVKNIAKTVIATVENDVQFETEAS